jgi:hypothetical protein
MKKLALTLVLSASLAACASNKDPVNGPLAKALAQEKNKANEKGEKTEAGCPELNGKYSLALEGATIDLTIATEAKDGIYAYSFDGADLAVADGQERALTGAQVGSLKVSCDSKSITRELTLEGATAPVTDKLTVVSEKVLERENTDATLNGKYTKAE